MPNPALVGNGHGGSEDYATLALWWAAEASVDYGVPIEAQCLGDCGTNYSLSGSSVNGAEIYTLGTDYDGSNESSLATTARINLLAPDAIIKHMKITNTSNFDNAIDLSGLNSICEFCRIDDTSTSGAGYGAILANSANAKIIRNCVISTTAAKLIRTGFDDPVEVRNCTGWGATSSGILASGSNQELYDNFFFDCNNAAFSGSFSVESNLASDDATATYTPYNDTELVDYASDDYRVKSTSFLATAGAGGSFIGAFLESSSGITVTASTAEYNYNSLSASIDLTGTIEVTAETAVFNYSSLNADIELTGTIQVIGSTAEYDYNSLPSNITLTGEIQVTAQTANYYYESKPADISLFGEIFVTGATASYNYSSLPGNISVFDVWEIKQPVSSSWDIQDGTESDWNIQATTTNAWEIK